MPATPKPIDPSIRRHPAADEIERRMDELKLSRREVARRAELGETSVRDILIGKSLQPQHNTLEKIAGALGCTVRDLTDPGAIPEEELDEATAEFRDLARHLDTNTVSAMLALLRVQAEKATGQDDAA